MACNTKDNIRERINGLENRIEEFREKGNKDIVSRLMNDYNTVAKKTYSVKEYLFYMKDNSDVIFYTKQKS